MCVPRQCSVVQLRHLPFWWLMSLCLSGVVCRTVGFAPHSAALSGFFRIFYGRPQSQWRSSHIEPGVWAAQNKRMLSPTSWNTQRPDGLFICQVGKKWIEIVSECVLLYCCFSIVLLPHSKPFTTNVSCIKDNCINIQYIFSLFLYAFLHFWLHCLHHLLCSLYLLLPDDISP